GSRSPPRIRTPRSSGSRASSARGSCRSHDPKIMTAVFVTATGTDIGKTFLAAGLIRHCRAGNRMVDALKPVATGFDPGAPEWTDTGLLLAALGRPVTPAEIARVSPWRYAAP